MKRFTTVLLLLALVASACSDDANTTTSESPTATTSAPETTGGSVTTATTEAAATTTTGDTDGGVVSAGLEPGVVIPGVLPVGDAVREFLIAIPPDYSPDTPAPLLFDLHGRGGNAPGQAVTSKVTTVAWQEGFVVVHPQAAGGIPTWPVWSQLPDLPAEVAFFELMIDTLAAELSIDLDRVFVMGFSNGGGMAGRLACELPDRIRAIGVVAAANEGWDECEPTRPIPVLAIHGLDDTNVAFDGDGARLPYLPDWAAWWAESNGCEDDMVPQELATATRWEWHNCPEGATVTLIGLPSVGHEWPARMQALEIDGQLVWVGATEVIVDFFARL